jgi:hypothetical protein
MTWQEVNTESRGNSELSHYITTWEWGQTSSCSETSPVSHISSSAICLGPRPSSFLSVSICLLLCHLTSGWRASLSLFTHLSSARWNCAPQSPSLVHYTQVTQPELAWSRQLDTSRQFCVLDVSQYCVCEKMESLYHLMTRLHVTWCRSERRHEFRWMELKDNYQWKFKFWTMDSQFKA